MNNQNSLSLNPAQASRVVVHALKHRYPVLLVGAPGVGKTQLLEQAAAEVGHDIVMSYPAIEDPTDGKGLPWFNAATGEGDYQPMGVLKRIVEASRPTLWVLEDLGQATEAVQAAYMSTLSARVIGSHPIPECVTVMATTNRKEHRSGVRGLLEPVKSRFKTIVDVAPSIDAWVEWAMSAGVSSKVISYLRMNPDELLVMEPTLEIRNSRNPRTWHALSQWVGAELEDDIRLAVYAGAVGEEGARKFFAFEDILADLPAPESVLLTPESAPIPSNPSTLDALLKAVAHYVDDASFPNVVRYAERLYESGQGELAGMLIKDCLRRHESLLSSSAFITATTGQLADVIQ